MCVCVTKTVREKFPAGAKIEAGSNISHALQPLKSAYVLNSLIVLGDVRTPNSEIEYKYQRSSQGTDFRFDPSLNKLTVSIRYERLVTSDERVASVYGNYTVERSVVADSSLICEHSEFEAFNCLFAVVKRANHNSNTVNCRVTKQYRNNDNNFQTGSFHNFTIEFVNDKIREYLS